MNTVTSAPSSTVATVHKQLCRIRREQIQSEARLALLLARFAAIGGHASLGFASIREYADAELQLSSRQTMDFVRLGRSLPELPVLHAALEAGEIGIAKTRELLRVIDPDNEAGWVDYASHVNCRTLEHAVAAAEPGDAAPGPHDPIAPSRVRLVFEVDAVDADVFRTALTHLRGSESGADDGALLAQMGRMVLSGGGIVASVEAVPEARYRVVVERCPECRLVTHVGQNGLREITAATEAEIECHHEKVDPNHPTQPGRLTRSIPDTVRREVSHRDGYRCAVPGCTNRHWLDFHHIIPHAQGGTNTADNLVLLCTVHHKLHHNDRLTIQRTAGGDLVFQRPCI